ncbi:MAG: FtsX-like permease family protein, partial [Gammaproteobacteria bacterium]
LADDLGVEVGDEIALKYFVAGLMRKLIERESNFVVRSIVAINGAAADVELMPAYPGLADVENCRDWRPGIDIDIKKIRDKDEEYWDMYRGTPKGFITLRAAQRIWDNRFGKLTAVRYPVKGNTAESITQRVLSSIDAGGAGLYFQPVLEAGLKAGGEGSDFGQLFLGLSMFLIMAAVILVGLVFVFGVEKRSSEAGLLLAVGFSRRVVKTVFLLEGAVLAVVGGLAGAVAGVGYTWAMIYGLGTVWADAVSGSRIQFFARSGTVLIGWWAAAGVSLIAIWFGLHRQLRRSSRQLLEPVAEGQILSISKSSKGRGGFCVAAVATVGAGAILWFMGGEEAAGAFFGAGALLLVGEVGLAHGLLGMIVSKWGPAVKSVAGLGLRNVVRRSGRSLAVVGLLACGVFMVVGVGANHKDPTANVDRRDSGTGGFGLFGQSAIGVLHDLNTQDGRGEFGLSEDEMRGVDVVGLRVRQGDDASCLNLNRAQRPRLLGVEAEQLEGRRAFSFIKTIENEANEKDWGLVDIESGDGVVPAVGDYATVYWALGKRLGDEIEYVDERGRRFKVRIVGMIENSILQGSLVISEKNFIERFGSVAGHRMFLIDAPAERVARVSDKLSSALRDYGMDIVPAGERLAMFSVVEHTYLKIFLLLGGLGLVLGTLGLGLVVLRNVLDRRGELGMIRAVGFDRGTLKRMVLYEHAGLLAAGLLFGVAAAAIAVGPVLKTPGAP